MRWLAKLASARRRLRSAVVECGDMALTYRTSSTSGRLAASCCFGRGPLGALLRGDRVDVRRRSAQSGKGCCPLDSTSWVTSSTPDQMSKNTAKLEDKVESVYVGLSINITTFRSSVTSSTGSTRYALAPLASPCWRRWSCGYSDNRR